MHSTNWISIKYKKVLEGVQMYDYFYYDEFLDRQSPEFISNLEKAINGEYSAIHCYEKLAQLASDENEQKQIIEIRQDEIKHYRQFVQIYTNLTGHSPQPKITEECPNTYVDGLEAALQDEQETVDFYLGISDSTTQPVKEMFRRAALDEQNHAVWFLYYFLKNR